MILKINYRIGIKNYINYKLVIKNFFDFLL